MLAVLVLTQRTLLRTLGHAAAGGLSLATDGAAVVPRAANNRAKRTGSRRPPEGVSFLRRRGSVFTRRRHLLTSGE